MNGISRLVQHCVVSLRPAVRQAAEEESYRRRRLLLTAPLGAVLGTWMGAAAAPDWGWPRWGGALAGAVSLVLFFYLMSRVEPPLRRLLGVEHQARGPLGFVLAWDGMLGAGLGKMASVTVGVSLWESLTAGSSLFLAYCFVVRRLYFEDGIDRLIGLFFGMRGMPGPPEYSHAAALAARGQDLEAIREYEAAVSRRPHDPVPYVRIARIHESRRRYQSAVEWYRRARAQARLDPAADVFTARRIAELCSARLDAPADARAELLHLADHHAHSPAGEWARGELGRLPD